MRQYFRLKDDQNIYRIYYRTFQGAIESLNDNNELMGHLDELKWFYEQNKDGLLKKVKFTLFLRERADSIPPVFMITQRNNLSELHKIIDKVVSTDFLLSSYETDIINSAIQNLKEEKPFVNFFGNEEMCLSISNGYALLGYFFLRLHDKGAFPPLPFQFEDK